jgi:hypothetical protein
MTGQLSYNALMDVASEGLKADSGFDNVLSPRAFEDIAVGSGVSKVGGVDYQVRLPAQNLATVVLDADLVTSNSIAVTVNGVALTPIVFAVSHDDTMDAIAAAIAAEPNIASATVGDANNRTITVVADQGEVAFVDSFVVTLGASQATATITNTTSDGLYGVALRTQNKMNLYASTGSDGAAPYYEGDCVSMLTKGRVYVYVEDTLDSDDAVYMRFAPNGANTRLGVFRSDDDSGTAVLVPDAVWRVGASAGGLAVLEINKPN